MLAVIKDASKKLYQWDTGKVLYLEDAADCNEVHFSSDAENAAYVCQVKEENDVRFVQVPNCLLQRDGLLYVHFCYAEGDRVSTLSSQKMQVWKRAKPESYIYTESEVLNYSVLSEKISFLVASIYSLSVNMS